MTLNCFRIAMIDDDRNFLQVMSLALQDEFAVSTFDDPKGALKIFSQELPDAVLLDLHMGDVNGLEVCQQIKTQFPKLPVFFLTSDSDMKNISEGLRTGGIDYFPKNMPPVEIAVRIKARLDKGTDRILSCRNIVLDMDSHGVRIGSENINLTPKEFDILKVFLQHQDELLSKNKILDLLWKDISVDANNIDTHMFHIRKKFGETIGIECKKGVGYILRSHL